ncbi:hypothetical protein [Neptuniibacter sp. CAU 1671]|uniref:hypothetical protein n=1 Tax=Neptuniibacter sp. CAU 1671 TaxID=3032593 RepID=UPI0023D9C3F1|nr:hypothetical protein [Neptuniibacter sp. CAU 1671]MDF2182316.1 hypothetical protein [Neptuniibacter sp. CAU 1671]
MRQTFRALITLLVVVLAGCAGQPKSVQPPVEEKKALKVTPVEMVLVQAGLDLQLDYAQPLLTTLRQTAFYRAVNSERLASSYTYAGEVNTGAAPRLVQVYQQSGGKDWGYITTSATQSSVANAFQMENTPQGTLYALVIKQARICLTTQASGAPTWNGHKLVFASQPGFFECTGMTNSSLFQPGSSIPAMLGPYYGDGDTVLVFRDFATLNRVMSALKQRLPEIRIPKIY